MVSSLEAASTEYLKDLLLNLFFVTSKEKKNLYFLWFLENTWQELPYFLLNLKASLLQIRAIKRDTAQAVQQSLQTYCTW